MVFPLFRCFDVAGIKVVGGRGTLPTPQVCLESCALLLLSQSKSQHCDLRALRCLFRACLAVMPRHVVWLLLLPTSTTLSSAEEGASARTLCRRQSAGSFRCEQVVNRCRDIATSRVAAAGGVLHD